MCEQTDWMDELKRLRFALGSLPETVGTTGSYERENVRNLTRGIESRLNWCIGQAAREVKRGAE